MRAAAARAAPPAHATAFRDSDFQRDAGRFDVVAQMTSYPVWCVVIVNLRIRLMPRQVISFSFTRAQRN